MDHCRFCECKLYEKEKGQGHDGLCILCHMSLCQSKATGCLRCMEFCEKILDWVKKVDKDGFE